VALGSACHFGEEGQQVIDHGLATACGQGIVAARLFSLAEGTILPF
jgi:hypothetical protein